MATTPATRKLSAEARRVAKATDGIVGLQDGDVAVLTLASIVAMILGQVPALPALGSLASVSFPTGTEKRYLNNLGQWEAIVATAAGVVAATQWKDLNGAPSDNTALMTLIGLLAPKENAIFTGSVKVPLAALNANDENAVNASWARRFFATLINDTLTAGGANTWSVTRIAGKIEERAQALKNELTGGAASALDTLGEVSAALQNDPSAVAGLLQSVGNRLRFDGDQTLTDAQKAQALKNLGLADLFSRLLPPANQGAVGDAVFKTLNGSRYAPLPTSSGVPADAADPDNFAAAIASMAAASTTMRANIAALT